MKYTIPDYYQEFSCIAGECPATCCAGWQIVIDERSLNRYRKFKGAFGNRLINSIDWEQGTFLQYDGRCAFLNEQNLCDIYTEAGAHMFCRTCRNYPRHIEEFENEREISLSLSCPAAAKLILEKKEPVLFLTAEKDSEEEEIEGFDFFLYSALQDCRNTMIEILQDRKEPVAFRMAKVLALAHDVQNRLDARQIFEVEPLLERYQRAGANEKLKRKMAVYQEQEIEIAEYEALLGLLDHLEVLDSSWTKQIRQDRAVLTDIGSRECWMNLCGTYETELEQLMVYFIFTYFCGAVYDGEAFVKVKMAVACTLILLLLWKAERIKPESYQENSDKADEGSGQEARGVKCASEDWEKQDFRSEKEWSSMLRTAWHFSRELEHSDLNLDKMEEMMKTQKAASFEQLLKLCLQI